MDSEVVSFDDSAVIDLEDIISCMPGQLDLPVKNYFSDELYARSLHLPAGTVFTGRVHKRAHFMFIMSGSIKIMTDDGVRLIDAPAILPSKAGTKRAGYAITDVLMVTVHHCLSKNEGDALDEIVEPVRPSIVKVLEKTMLEDIK